MTSALSTHGENRASSPWPRRPKSSQDYHPRQVGPARESIYRASLRWERSTSPHSWYSATISAHLVLEQTMLGLPLGAAAGQLARLSALDPAPGAALTELELSTCCPQAPAGVGGLVQ